VTSIGGGSEQDRRSEGPDKVACRSCTHPRDAHEHHRRGTDCSRSGCGCLQWKRPLPRLLALVVGARTHP
jgi:hypothetical protein